MTAIQTMKRSDTQKRTGGLDFLKHRRFKMGARMCLLYDGFFLLPSCGIFFILLVQILSDNHHGNVTMRHLLRGEISHFCDI